MAGRMLFENVQVTFHVPLPLALGGDRLAKGLLPGCFLAASAVYVGLGRTGRGNGWAGTTLILGSYLSLLLMVTCKSDVPAGSGQF